MSLLSINNIATMSRGELEDSIRSRVQTIYIGDGCVLSRVLGRQKIYLSTTDIGFAGNVMMDGFWEIWLTQFFARIIRPGMTVIDVGANFGYYTLLFSEAVGPQGNVLAVEPVPSTAAFLSRSVTLNGYNSRVKLIQAALGSDKKSEVRMYMPPGEPKNARVTNSSAHEGVFSVKSTSIDTIAWKYENIDLIKIDAEGAEEEIFAGMKSVLARHRPCVLLEFNAARSRNASVFLRELRGSFKSLRYLNHSSLLVDVTDEELLNLNVNDDWLLYLES